MKLWQKLLFYLIPGGVLFLVGQFFAALTLSTAYSPGVEKWMLVSLCIAIILCTILVWKGERFALVPAIAANALFSIWYVATVFSWEDDWNMKVLPDLVIFLTYGLSGLAAGVVLAVWGPKHCGPYMPLKD